MAEGDKVQLPPNKPAGRKPLQLDAETVTLLASIGCTQNQIARLLKCDDNTLRDNYSAALKEGLANRDYSLTRALFHKAIEERHFGAMVWLSKNWWKWSDRIDTDINATLTVKDETQEKINAMAEQLDQMLGELSQPVVVSLPKGLLPDQQS